MPLTIEVVNKAIMGAQIRNNGELYASYDGIPEECLAAAQEITDHYSEFEALLWFQLEQPP